MIAASILEYMFITVTCCGEITEKLYVAVSTKDVAIAILTAGKHAHTQTRPSTLPVPLTRSVTSHTTGRLQSEQHQIARVNGRKPDAGQSPPLARPATPLAACVLLQL